MAVPAYKREESDMEFLKLARDIEGELIKLLRDKPKKYRFFYQQIISLSIEVLNNVKSGNSVYVESRYDAELRMRYFKLALAKLQVLISQIEVLHYVLKNDGISMKSVEILSKMIYKEIILIKGVLKACRAKYSALLGT